jgi:hypothetical protein
VVCGVPQSIVNDDNSKWTVNITTDTGLDLTAWLQEKFVFNVSSDWTDIAKIEGLTGVVSDAFQAVTQKSLMSTINTRRKWRGSSPVSLTMKLKFEAFENVRDEVIKPCQYLQALTLPSGGNQDFLANEQLFLTPPGPNPFYFPVKEGVPEAVKGKGIFGPGQQISISIGGGFVNFRSVIVTSVEVTFESRMTADGPVGAEVVVNFQTYEMLTKERLAEAYGMTVNAVPQAKGIGFADAFNATKELGREAVGKILG